MSSKFFRRLSAAEVDQMRQQADLCIFDSRDEQAFQRSHIDGAVRLHSGNLDQLILATPRRLAILIYCYHGIGSQQYASMFADFGFSRVHDLIGGYEAWSAYAATRDAVRPLSAALVRWLTEHGFAAADPHATIANATTALMHAARLGEVALVEELIALGAPLDAVNLDGNNALWLACFSGDIDTISALLHAGIDRDHQNDNGATCLMYAASAGKTAVVARLLAGGARLDLKSLDDFSALDMAANLEILQMLRQAERAVCAPANAQPA